MKALGAFDIMAATDGSVERATSKSGTASLIYEWADKSTTPDTTQEYGWEFVAQTANTAGPLAASKTAESIALRDALLLLLQTIGRSEEDPHRHSVRL